MKTNVELKSSQRVLFGVQIRQETKTGFLCLTDLQEAYTHARIEFGWSDSGAVQNLLYFTQNIERIYYLLKENGKLKYANSQGVIINSCLHELIKQIDNQVVTENMTLEQFIKLSHELGTINLLKKIGVYATKGHRKNRATWCDPYIWVLMAMELNPMLYGKVVTWITDKLILNRIEAGNMYKEFASGIDKLDNRDFQRAARAINWIVFNRHETGIRNSANEKQLKEIEDLEKKLAFAMDMGYIKTYDELIREMRKMYVIKWKTENPDKEV